MNTIIIGIEGGGTRTRAAAYTRDGTCVAEAEGPGSNPCAYGLERSVAVIADVVERLREKTGLPVREVCASIAGTGPHSMRDALGEAIAGAIQAPLLLTGDLQPMLAANAGDQPAVLVVAGTGSCVYARQPDGLMRGWGGRGAVFSDEGSAYALAVGGLKAASAHHDDTGPKTVLYERLPEAAGLPSFSEVPAWAEGNPKDTIASLAPIVIEAAEGGDMAAKAIVASEAAKLITLVAEAARWATNAVGEALLFQHGGLLEHSPYYQKVFRRSLLEAEAQADPAALRYTGPRAAAEMILQPDLASQLGDEAIHVTDFSGPPPLPPTERPADAALPLDALDAPGIVRAMLDAEREAIRAIDPVASALAGLVVRAAACIRDGGRIVYAGAGTSGRLGVLDASECVATFGIAPGRVIGIIAGGEPALRASIEGAEDDTEAAVAFLEALEPPFNARDLLVGIAASGTTPFVHAAIAHARQQRAATAMVCCNARAAAAADYHLALDTGPEVLPGSTRLKAGTATKRVLNIISTGAMALSGFLFEGRMVGVRPTNVKLRARAVRIVRELTNTPEEVAAELLDRAGGDIRVAVLMGRRGFSEAMARKRLAAAQGILRDALGL